MPNEAARADWNGSSGQAWVADADRRDDVLRPVLDALLDAASLGPGEGVLDVGCGCGATSIAAAGAVGSTGSVLGIDLSEPMLDVARRRATDAGLGHLRFVVGDAQVDLVPGGHDVAISRFGTMFFDASGDAFANIAAALSTGGRLCMATWQPLADNPWLVVPAEALLRHGSLPPTDPSAPGMFAQSSASTITGLLGGAGFTDVDVQPVTVDLRLGADAADATDYLAGMGLSRAVLEPLGPSQRASALAAVTAALADHADATGVTLAAGVLVTTASR
ncbi:MAG: Methyltransferase type 11 [Actinomycetia bacterium]|nr:Methyltransferase type 11 [Actinomycetes bacterium]